MNEIVGLDRVTQAQEPVLLAPRFRACLVSRSPLSVFGLSPDMPELSLTVERLDELDKAVRTLASRRSGWNLVLVALDDFYQDASAIDHFRRLRSRCPNLPVILISASFRRDDLGQDRLAITDASLASPFSAEALGRGIEAAVVNNLAWRKRRRSLLLERARLAQ